MTCIVGFIDRENKKIFIGADSAGVGSYHIRTRKDSKVFIRDPFIMGFTSSFRMGQLLMSDDRFNIRRQKEGESNYEYMVSAFIPAVQKLFKDGGFLESKSDVLGGGTFLVGYNGCLYEIQDDFQVAEYADDFMAIGCGEPYALGSLYTSSGSIVERITKALECAEYFSSGVRRPFKILSL